MANGIKVIEEVKELLKDERGITVKAALKLSLEMQLELNNAVKEVQEQMVAMSKRLEVVERNSIMLWVSRHPKLAVFCVTMFIVITALVDLRVLLSKALGIDL